MKKKYSPPVIRARKIVFDRLVLAGGSIEMTDTSASTQFTSDDESNSEAKTVWGCTFGCTFGKDY